MSAFVIYLAASVLLHISAAQRGCPVEGCDARGLYCQADFQIDSHQAGVVWQTSTGNITNSDLSMEGCIGNQKNVLCRVTDSRSKGYVSINATNGALVWYDTLLTNPRVPVMNIQGDIIATDGNFLEIRLKNGSLIGKPLQFHGFLANASSIHYINEVAGVFFFTSYMTGGLYLFDTSGMCVASNFIDEKDPKTNKTISTWKAVSKIVVNNEIDPPCGYFIAQNNVTGAQRLTAINFNHQPPYLIEKWNMKLSLIHASEYYQTQLLTIGRTLLVGGSNFVLIVKDLGIRGAVTEAIGFGASSFASYDQPLSLSDRRSSYDTSQTVWMGLKGLDGSAYIQGSSFDKSGSSSITYFFNLTKIFNYHHTALTSQIMVFGYTEDDQTLVFAFTGSYRQLDCKTSRPCSSRPGNWLVAAKPSVEYKLEILWMIPSGPGWEIRGQIIGVNDNMLLANAYNMTGNVGRLIGIKLG